VHSNLLGAWEGLNLLFSFGVKKRMNSASWPGMKQQSVLVKGLFIDFVICGNGLETMFRYSHL
jgi:hypothetical protein